MRTFHSIGLWSSIAAACWLAACGGSGNGAGTDSDTATDTAGDADGTTDPAADDAAPPDGEDTAGDSPGDGAGDTAEDPPGDGTGDTAGDSMEDAPTDSTADAPPDTAADTITDVPADDGPCSYGDTRCNVAGNVETCGAGGTWSVTQICADSCLDGACIYSSFCVAGDRRCRGLVAEQCNSLGTGWIVTDVCVDGCLSGLCTGVCVNGDRRCNGHIVEECTAGTWVAFDDCGTTFCVHDMCADSDLVVDGTTVTMGGEHWYVSNVVVRNFATINVDPAVGWLEIHAGGDLEIDATSVIQANAMACDARGAGQAYTGSFGGGGGAGHDVAGSDGYWGYGGAAYGSLHDVEFEAGACGGAGRCQYGGTAAAGGTGGGSVALFADGIVQMEGTITASGSAGASNTSYNCGGGGGGSGGTILLFGDIVNTGTASAMRADGAAGGSGYSGYNGGAGAAGRIKVLYGQAAGSTIAGTHSGRFEDSVAPPYVLTSPTHPEESRWYNDGFDEVLLTWDRPTNMAVSAYFWLVGTSAVDPPYSGHGTWLDVETLPLDPSDLVVGTTVFHVTTLDADLVTGTIENHFEFHVNAAPPAITSTSHPAQTTFYTDPNVLLFWTDPQDHSNYTEYVWAWDRYADTTPTPILGTHTVDMNLMRPGTPVGIWYLHVVSIDTMGYPTLAARHFRVNVGTAPATGNITGVVRSSVTSAFIGGASVKVNGGIWTTSSSTLNGAYSFGSAVYDNTGWPIWEVSCEADGYQRQTLTASVTGGSTTNVDFYLDPI